MGQVFGYKIIEETVIHIGPSPKGEKVTAGEREAVKKCRDCKTLFSIQAEHVQWYVKKGLFLPARCQKCLDKRNKKKRAPDKNPGNSPEYLDPTPLMTSVTFDAGLLQLLQDAAETFEAEHKNLVGRPIQDLTTFKDLDRLFTSGAELIASLKLNAFLCPEEEEEDLEQAEKEELLPDTRTLAEKLRSVGIKVEDASPHETEEPAPVEAAVEVGQ
ncbi:hypothetical protein LCGC14_0516600 [marine sediment metagenome]|uniref:Uncharacterized protein n=1 Tax=marine sediment metagenome TaxID=412755 RepID=A0A0F9SI65_9ZZZZ